MAGKAGNPGKSATWTAKGAATPAHRGLFYQVKIALLALFITYLIVGILVLSALAFLAPGHVGSDAFSQPRSYLVLFLWPYSLWSLLGILLV